VGHEGPGRDGERVEELQQLGRASRHRRALRVDRCLLAARDRAGERAALVPLVRAAVENWAAASTVMR
jgi:hypothetical protein